MKTFNPVLYKNLLIKADNMSGEEGLVEYPDQEVDVQWYGRQCARLKSKAVSKFLFVFTFVE